VIARVHDASTGSATTAKPGDDGVGDGVGDADDGRAVSDGT